MCPVGKCLLILSRLFTEHPEMLEMFSFKNIGSAENFKSDERALRQARKTMEAVNLAVSRLNDTTALVRMLKGLGARHVDYKVKEEHYGVSTRESMWGSGGESGDYMEI